MLVTALLGATLPPQRVQRSKRAVALFLTLLLPFIVCQVSGSLEVPLDSLVANVTSPKELQDAARAGVPHIVGTAHLDISTSLTEPELSGIIRVKNSTRSIVVRLLLAVVRIWHAMACGWIFAPECSRSCRMSPCRAGLYVGPHGDGEPHTGRCERYRQ